MPSLRTSLTLLVVIAGSALFAVACGGGGSSTTGTPTATTTAVPRDPLVPPLEGPDRVPYLGSPMDFRQDPAYQLPSPNDVPSPTDSEDPVLNPPAQPDCPDGWKVLQRPTEGFQFCYPADWDFASDGYKNAPNETRWYSLGVFKFPGAREDDHQFAHVSVYVIPQGARPFTYTKDCPTPYSVVLDGQPAVVCPDFPAASPEARIISYHVFRSDLDYFINIALYFKYDDSKGAYTDQTDSEALAAATKIIGSFTFTEVQPAFTPSPTASAAGSPTP